MDSALLVPFAVRLRVVLLAFVISLLALGVACGGGSATTAQLPPPAPPAITSFTVSPLIIGPAAKTVLTATFSGGKAVIDQGVGAVSNSVGIASGPLSSSTTYTLTVTNSAGISAQAKATVHVGSLVQFAGIPSTAGYKDATGYAAQFESPEGVVADASGNIYVADANNSVIRQISPLGVVTTVAGAARQSGSTDGVGAAARFVQPLGIAIDSAGNLYVTDQTIRKIAPGGVVTTIAGAPGHQGSADGVGAAAQFMVPEGIATDSSGNLYVADTGNNTIRKITPAGVVTTLAGSAGQSGTADGIGASARFYFPVGIAVDGSGNVYVSDSWNSTIRKITPAGLVSTFAGSPGLSGFADGTGSQARFYYPYGLATDASGNVYVEDSGNNETRMITPAGVVTTLAGTYVNSFVGGSADGIGSAAQFYGPWGITVDAGGQVYVSDSWNSTIRKITPAGVVTTFAGTPVPRGHTDGSGATAQFWYPTAAIVDASGNVFVTDTDNYVIRKISPSGSVSTYAGTPNMGGATDGPRATALFEAPWGIAADGAGNLYVADMAASTIRKISTDGTVSTLAGSPGQSGSADGIGSAARFSHPTAVAASQSGSVYVADRGNATIRQISASGVVTTLAGSPGQQGIVDGTGSAARFSGPNGIVVDASGNVYVADQNLVRMITPGGVVSTLAGNLYNGSADGLGSAAQFSCPESLSIDKTGNVFVADFCNHLVRMVTPAGNVTTIAGTAGLAENIPGALPASVRWPMGVAVDSNTEELYILLENAVLKTVYQ
jgi:sugar lactone lactonase YvrE